MPNFRIAKNLKLKIQPYGECKVHARLSNGEIQFFRTANNEFFSLTEEKFIAGVFDGAVEVIYDESSPLKSRRKNQFPFSFVEFAPPALRKEALRRYRYVIEIINKDINTITEETVMPVIKEIAQKIGDSCPPSLSSSMLFAKYFAQFKVVSYYLLLRK